MAIEVYKHEVGTNLGTWVTRWAFYWEVANTSGRTQEQVSWDIALSLEGFLNWFSQFRDFWDPDNLCQLYRIRRVWPTIDSWNDFFWYFCTYGGRFNGQEYVECLKVRIKWHTASWELAGACTYLNMWPTNSFENNRLTGDALTAAGLWADLHDAVHTTAFGDQFRPCILEKSGNYLPVIGHWVDPRPVASRVHRWRG